MSCLLQWRHNEQDDVSNHQPNDCLFNGYSDADKRKHQSVTGLCEGNSPVTGDHLMTSSCFAVVWYWPIYMDGQYSNNSSPQTTFSNDYFNEKFCTSIQMSLKFVPMVLIDNKSALVQVMSWYRTGDKPLPEPMRTQFAEAFMRH